MTFVIHAFQADDAPLMAAAREIRNAVFCDEQGVPPELEWDGHDKTCEHFLLEQLAIIKPRVICALGKIAAQTLLRTETPISRLRGKIFYYHDIMLVPTFHPAYLLRNPAGKRAVWEDMKKIRRLIGEEQAASKPEA